MIKIKYNSQTTLIEGNYPLSINYPNIVIDEDAKTIDGSPYIEITEEEHEANMGKVMCVIDGVYQEYVKPDDVLLQEAKDSKKTEIKALRDAEFQKPLQIRSNPDIYLKPQPQTNIFLAAYSMADGAIKEWKPCDIDGVMQDGFIEVTKEELISASNHYEERKTLEYNQYHKRIDAIEALTTIEEVEAFDINQIIV
jgi:hypothetical protein